MKMSKVGRTLIILTTLLVVMFSILVLQYSLYSSQLSSQDRTIKNLQGTISNQSSQLTADNQTNSQLQTNVGNLVRDISDLRSNTSSLLSKISSLLSKISSLQTNMSSLREQVSSLENQSAIQQWELFNAEAFGSVNVTVLAYNQTISVPANSTYLLVSDVPGYNGTVRLDYSSPGCPIKGYTVGAGNGTVDYYFTLNYYSPLSLSAFNVNSTPFSIYFQNTGPRNVTCGFTLTYDYHLP
jgi:hypothetical protein